MEIPEQYTDERNAQPSNHKEKDGKECQRMKEMLERWAEWTKECFSKEHNDLAPKITHIADKERGGNFLTAPTDLQEIRRNADITKITNDKPQIESWLSREYSEQYIETELRNLALKKSTWGRWNTRRGIQSHRGMGSKTNNQDHERNQERKTHSGEMD